MIYIAEPKPGFLHRVWLGFLIFGGWGGLNMIDHGRPFHGVVTFLFFVFLWKWRRVFEFIQDREWRDW
jgi:lipoprotein signal peptidase